ncbi:CPBP family intramembrane glutamic endopeptidase [Pseudodesulfovibrio sediminis]|uniref:Abortive infection protein n=1 Tax=Pseudodesulfovibrio sediminis TaxID=2810563 RepID=A0ABN6EQX1_9BACT|nr:CPBP family intramembrane glutamic endopeptidase [Pseudodesulfovibrio sediminis]BCS87825.1 abortive infection protein [Pseudodesulfovibrio sediminis]
MHTSSANPLMNKPVLTFLGLTFAVTWGIEIALIAGGMDFTPQAEFTTASFWLLAFMWIPGLVSILVCRFMEGVRFTTMRAALSIRIGTSIKPYLLTILLIPLLFGVIYLLTLAAGLTTYDAQLATAPGEYGAELTPDTLLHIFLPVSIVLGPFINLFFGLGEEIGWRGFLLPRLMPMGKTKAYTMMGIIWGLWHAPLIYAGFNYPGFPVSGIIMMCVISVAFGIFMNELTLHYGSSVLPAFIHGAFNAQGQGIWMWLFPITHPLLGGPFGLVGALCWTCLSLTTIWILARFKHKTP